MKVVVTVVVADCGDGDIVVNDMTVVIMVDR